MVKINKRIVVLRSSQIRLSSLSQESTDALAAVLTKHYKSVELVIANTPADLETVKSLNPDLVFLGIKYVQDNPRSPKLWVADYLDKQNIAYTGSGHQAHKLELNKHLAKQCALDAGLQTSPFYVALQNELQSRSNMPLIFPLFVKPSNRGGGLGVDSYSVVRNFDELESKVNWITSTHQSDSLVEEYLTGREFSVAILKDEHNPGYYAMPIELITEVDSFGVRVLSEQVKSSNSESAIEVGDKLIKAKVSKLALDVFNALGGRDYGRIDIRFNNRGVAQFLEANLLPSLIDGYGSFPKACALNIGLSYEQMILSIVRLGLRRNAGTHDEPEHLLDHVIIGAAAAEIV